MCCATSCESHNFPPLLYILYIGPDNFSTPYPPKKLGDKWRSSKLGYLLFGKNFEKSKGAKNNIWKDPEIYIDRSGMRVV